MSACVRPLRSEPSFFLYRALASLNALDNFLSEALADRDRFLTGGVGVRSRSAREEPSDSRSEVTNRINAMYSSGVSIMSRAKGLTSLAQEFGVDKSGVSCAVCFRTDNPKSAVATLGASVVGAFGLQEEVVCSQD